MVGALLPPAAKTHLSNQTKGAIGEGLSSIGLSVTGRTVVDRGALNGVGKSSFDFLLDTGRFVESKFGTAKLSGPQRIAAKQQGDNLEVHFWDYPTVSGLLSAGPAAALGFGSAFPSIGLQSFDVFGGGLSLSPNAVGASVEVNVRQQK